MKKRILSLLCIAAITVSLFSGCGNSDSNTSAKSEATESTAAESTSGESDTEESSSAVSEDVEKTEDPAAQPFVPLLEDGVYTADVDTDSSMFHINESCEGKCTLVVQDGAITAHLILGGTGILYLYQGTKEEAQADEDNLIDHTVESVTYSDGITEDVFAFDVPVPVLDEEFPVAIIGEHDNWYDHTVIISNPVPAE